MSAFAVSRQWIKAREHWLARLAYGLAMAVRRFEVPLIGVLHGSLYSLHRAVVGGAQYLARILYWTPLFKSQLVGSAPRLYLYSGMPLLSGPLRTRCGADCRISGHSTFSARTASHPAPELIIGDNVGIGWQTTIAVGGKVVLGDNVRIAGRALLAGYPGHPIDARARARGEPDTEDQIGDIVLEEDVWLGTGVTVSAGVRIGRGTVVAAGSVVTRDLPPGVMAGGVPARVIRHLEPPALEVVS